MVDGEYRQVMLSARELSYRHLPSRGWINERLTYTHGYGLVAGPVNRISPEGLPEFFLKDIPPKGTGLPDDHAPRDLLRRVGQRLRLRPHALPGARLPVRRPERLHALRGQGRDSRQLLAREARLRHPLRRGEDPALRRPDRGEPGHDLSGRGSPAPPGGAVPALRPRSVPGDHRRRAAGVDDRRLHRDRPLPVRRAGARARQLHAELRQGGRGRLPRHASRSTSPTLRTR